MTLSAVVLTKNSSNTIAACIASLRFCDEIIVVDDTSTDTTLELAKKSAIGKKLYILKHDLNHNFSQSRNFGLAKASGEWVLFIDSDEIVSQELAKEILETIRENNDKGYYLKRTDEFMGAKLEYGETASVRLLRLGKKGGGLWEGRVHEIWKITGNVGSLEQALIHNHTITMNEYLIRLDSYSTIKAQEMYENGIREPFIFHLIKPVGKFIHNYIFSLGFLDGYPGLVMAWLMSWHSLLVRIKLRMLYLNMYSSNS